MQNSLRLLNYKKNVYVVSHYSFTQTNFGGMNFLNSSILLLTIKKYKKWMLCKTALQKNEFSAKKGQDWLKIEFESDLSSLLV